MWLGMASARRNSVTIESTAIRPRISQLPRNQVGVNCAPRRAASCSPSFTVPSTGRSRKHAEKRRLSSDVAQLLPELELRRRAGRPGALRPQQSIMGLNEATVTAHALRGYGSIHSARAVRERRMERANLQEPRPCGLGVLMSARTAALRRQKHLPKLAKLRKVYVYPVRTDSMIHL